MKNTKKSPAAYVSGHRVSMKRRMTFPFISADKYDPKPMSTYLGYDLQPPRKFFLATQSPTLHSERSRFRPERVKTQL